MLISLVTLKRYLKQNNGDIIVSMKSREESSFSNITNYKGYFDDIDETGNWTTGIYVIIKD